MENSDRNLEKCNVVRNIDNKAHLNEASDGTKYPHICPYSGKLIWLWIVSEIFVVGLD